MDLFIYEFLGFYCFCPQQNIKIATWYELCISGGWDEAPAGTRGCPSACLLKTPPLWQTCPPTGSASLYFLCPRGRDSISHTYSASLSIKITHTLSETQKANTHTHRHTVYVCIVHLGFVNLANKWCKSIWKMPPHHHLHLFHVKMPMRQHQSDYVTLYVDDDFLFFLFSASSVQDSSQV